MVRVTRISNIHKGEYDFVYALVRYMRFSEWIIHVPELSPSVELFTYFRQSKNNGTWGKDTFDNYYKPKFIDQINNDPRALEKLNEIINLDKEGKSIALVCFCKDEDICHRSIIADMLKDNGVNVIMDKDVI